MPRARLLGAPLLAFLLALGVLAVTAAACEGGGSGGKELTSLSTSLSGGGKEGAEITVAEGTKVKDKATLTGKNASKATGKVTYKVYSEKECKSLVKEAGEVTVSGESVPVSGEQELEAGKAYYWQAHYGGDTNNDESTSPCTEILKVQAKTSLSTKLTEGGEEGEEITINEGTKAKDKATLSGTNSSSAEGKVLYKIYSDKECKTLVKEAGEENVSGGSVIASSEEELEGGKAYYWQATYKGDSLHEESTSACGKEILKVKAKTTLATTLSGGGEESAEITIHEGTKAKDKATVEGTNSSTAEGKVLYKVYSDSKCEHLVAEAGEKSVSSGAGAASNEEELEGGKTYYWQATYKGDSLHQESKGTCGSEVSNVKASTTLSTELSGESKEGEELTVDEGAKVKDKATLSGTNSSNAGGKVLYKVYSDKECKTLVKEAGEETVTSGNPGTSGEEALEGGKTYYWQAIYKGDSLHQESKSTCGSEVSNVKARTTVSTVLSGEGKEASEADVQASATTSDDATLGGPSASSASGTVKYSLYSDSECKELVAEPGEASVTGGGASASSGEKLPVGRYYWQATYSGDALHQGVTSACGSEIEVVAAETSLTTSLSGGGKSGGELEVQEGVEVNDAATLSGSDASMATGTIEYNVYSDSECKTLVATTGSVLVVGGIAAPSDYAALPVGTYYWQAVYFGDSLNKPSTSVCGTEIEKVGALPITTSLSGEGHLGVDISVQEAVGVSDTATLNGANSSTATGIVKYAVYADSECKELVAEAGEVNVTSGSVPASSEQKLPLGVYYWQAVYSGDLTHSGATSVCGGEVEVVAEETALTTSLSGEGKSGEELKVREGAAVTDSATISGPEVAMASGVVEYKVYSDSGCKDLVAEVGGATVTSGLVPESSEVTLPTGTYYWQAVYFGDALNKASTSTCGVEIEKVDAASLTSSLSGDSKAGPELELEEEASVKDTATLNEENASTATGTVKYKVYSESECKTLITNAGEVTVTGGSIPASNEETLTDGSSYYWQATYSGDGTHEAATSLCSKAIEKVEEPWVVSVGDSYISGEGGRWAGNTENNSESGLIDALGSGAYEGMENGEPTGEAIALCHRSKSAEIFIGRDGAGNKVMSKNLACSGAETTSYAEKARFLWGYLLNEGIFKPGLDFVDVKRGEEVKEGDKPGRGVCGLPECIGQARQLQEFANGLHGGLNKAIKMVAVSIGGNDFKFSEVVQACLVAYFFGNECNTEQQARFEPAVTAEKEKAVEEGIANIGRAMELAGYGKEEYTILVQHYESPIPENGAEFRYGEFEPTPSGDGTARMHIGGCPFGNFDAKWANVKALKAIDETVKKAAENVNGAGKYKVVFMELKDAFKGRRLCETGLKLVGHGKPPEPPNWEAPTAVNETEWVNQIRLATLGTPFFQQEGLHPNYWGQLALRNCLRQAYSNGAPKGGNCVIERPGLTPMRWGEGLNAGRPEPHMELKP
jgi:hypothetical protein